MIKKLKYFIFPVAVLMPILTLAQVTDAVNGLVTTIQRWVALLMPTLIGAAIVLFFFGILRYLFSKDGPAKKEAKDFMMWGVVAVFVMVSVWGIVVAMQKIVFGDQNIGNVGNPIKPPVLPK